MYLDNESCGAMDLNGESYIAINLDCENCGVTNPEYYNDAELIVKY